MLLKDSALSSRSGNAPTAIRTRSLSPRGLVGPGGDEGPRRTSSRRNERASLDIYALLNGNSTWKLPLVARVFGSGRFSGKNSTPYGGGDNVHDFMHAKITVADDHVFTGSYNLSHSGEMNAENVLEIREPELAERLAVWIDQVRARYGPAPVPEVGAS
jgi:phosphatidylserine/phosphatidylglycerophosphate/cardiolipin synthase-like enzyme